MLLYFVNDVFLDVIKLGDLSMAKLKIRKELSQN